MADEKEVIERKAIGEVAGIGDGRTLDLRVVPYGVVARVSDNGRDYYDEVWMPGCFDRQMNAADRVKVKPPKVLMNFEHGRTISDVVGRGTELREAGDGLEGTFRMLNGQDADKALELVNEGVLTGVSLEAEPIVTERVDGVVKRIKARLINVALCRSPAFPEAEVMAVREAPDDPDEPLPDPEPDDEEEAAKRSEVDDLLERIGYEPLISRAVTKKPWDGSPARFEDAEYQRSCLIDRGGDAPVKERCSLPVLEPNGDINANALGAAAAAIAGARGGVKASGEQKAKAARKLMRYYRQASMEPPASLRMMAAR